MPEPRNSNSPPRLFVQNFLRLDQCKELEFILKSSSTVGYRPHVFSTTLSHLIATNCPQLILPLVPIREMLKEKVEEFFGCDFELCIEFTGLISWAKGASIGWHSDDNREYLKHRDFTAVCYLNSHGESFRGGLFHFKDGELQTVVPSAGDLLIYTADSNNIHSVEEVTDGERLTLTLWFSRNSTHDEDMKLISRLSQIYLNEESCRSFFPFPAPASSNMYLFSREQSFHEEFGINICFARLLVLGFSIYSSSDENLLEERCDILLKPLKLTRSDKLLSYEFSNILHALQVVQYYLWKSGDLPRPESTLSWGKVTELSHPQKEKVDKLKLALIKDHKLAWETFGFRCHESTELQDFNWACFSVAITAWEDYTSEKHKDLIRSLPHWINYQSIFCASFDTV